jgi:hypothetical protein
VNHRAEQAGGSFIPELGKDGDRPETHLRIPMGKSGRERGEAVIGGEAGDLPSRSSWPLGRNLA